MEILAHPDSELSRMQLQELAQRLSNKRREFLDALKSLNRQITAKDDCEVSDAADAASLQEDRDRASGIAEQYKWTIREIDAALIRLKRGLYGVSTASGEPISYARLSLIPWARTDPDD